MTQGTHATYGEEWRARALNGEELDSDERHRWLREKAWEEQNPTEVAALDRLVGKTVVTVKRLALIDGRVLPAETYLTVRARFGNRLLAETSGLRFLMLREWVRQVRVSPHIRKEPTSRDRSPIQVPSDRDLDD